MSFPPHSPMMEDVMVPSDQYGFQPLTMDPISAEHMQPALQQHTEVDVNVSNSAVSIENQMLAPKEAFTAVHSQMMPPHQILKSEEPDYQPELMPPSYDSLEFSNDGDMPMPGKDEVLSADYAEEAFPDVEPSISSITPAYQVDMVTHDQVNVKPEPRTSSRQNESETIHQLLTSSLFQLCHNLLTFKDYIHISGELKFSVDSPEEIHAIQIEDNIQAVSRTKREPEDDIGNLASVKTEYSLDESNPDGKRSTRSGNGPPTKQESSKPFGCAICGKSFITKSYVEKHIANHVYTKDVYIMSNIVYHQGKLPFKCEVCEEGFDEVNKLKIHAKTHPKPKGIRRPRIKKEYDTEFIDELNNMCELGTPNTGFEDDGLLEDFDDAEDIEASSRSLRRKRRGGKPQNNKKSPVQKPFGCAVCLKTFFTKSYLRKHIAKHKGVENVEKSIIYHRGENPFKCVLCGKEFDDKCTRKEHMQTHSEEKTHMCENCGKGFFTPAMLKQHMLTHDPNHCFKCHLCDKDFVTSSILKTHMTTHGAKEHMCDVCDKGFTRKTYLDIHKRIHTGVRPYKCKVCSKAFSASSGLAIHKRTHTGEKPYPCTQCSAKYAYKDSLTRHMFIHTGEKPEGRIKKHVCDECGKGFDRSRYLVIHKRTHTGEKPFVCEFCDKSFNVAWSLEVHRRTHTGEKPYQCTICGADLRYKNALAKHMAEHAGNKLPNPTNTTLPPKKRDFINELPMFNEHSMHAQSMDSFQNHDPHSQHAFQQHNQSPPPHPSHPQPPPIEYSLPPSPYSPHPTPLTLPPSQHLQHQYIPPQTHPIFPDRQEQFSPYAHQGVYPPKWGPFFYQM